MSGGGGGRDGSSAHEPGEYPTVPPSQPNPSESTNSQKDISKVSKVAWQHVAISLIVLLPISLQLDKLSDWREKNLPHTVAHMTSSTGV